MHCGELCETTKINVLNIILHNFYIDDYLKSVSSEVKAIKMVHELTEA